MSAPTVNGTAVHTAAERALFRADGIWCKQTCDEPLDEDRLAHYAAALEPHLGPTDADPEQLHTQLTTLRHERDTARAERDTASGQLADARTNQAVERELAKLRADCAALANERTELVAANTRLTDELEQAHQDAAGWKTAAECAAATRTELEDTIAGMRAELATAHTDNAELADDLAAARRTITGHEQSVTAVLAERDRLLDQLDTAQQHRCRWELDIATGRYSDCDCGRPWPRYYLDDAEPVEPELEPLAELMARVRVELEGWGTDG